MGSCTSMFDDEDERILKLKNKQLKSEMEYFREQLKKQRAVHSELGLDGKGISKNESKEDL